MSRHSRGPRCSQNEVKTASASALNWPMWCPTRVSKSLFFFVSEHFFSHCLSQCKKKRWKKCLHSLLPQFILHFQQSLRGPLPVATSQRASTFGQARLCMLCFVFVRRHRSLSSTHQEGDLFTASECEQKVMCKRIRQGCIDPGPGSIC